MNHVLSDDSLAFLARQQENRWSQSARCCAGLWDGEEAGDGSLRFAGCVMRAGPPCVTTTPTDRSPETCAM